MKTLQPQTAAQINLPQTGALALREPSAVSEIPHPAQILQTVLSREITPQSADVAEKILAMCREQKRDDARQSFMRAFFALRKELPNFYADKEVQTRTGAVAFTYCSPGEIKDKLEPLLLKHGFFTMTEQAQDTTGRVTVTVRVFHEDGHEEKSNFTTRVSPGNSLMSPSQCDAGASTGAERHCLIKMFGLRTRLRAEDDPRNEGGIITAEQAFELERRVAETNSDKGRFLALAGAASFAEIHESKYAMLDEMLARKERGGK